MDDTNGLRPIFENETKSIRAGYAQSHPYDFVLTSGYLATDEASKSNNYMQAVFGGLPNENDMQVLAYADSMKDFAASQFVEQPFVSVPDLGNEANKTALLESFAATRERYNGNKENEVQRFLNARGDTPERTVVTYYGKRDGRFHNIVGQDAYLQYAPGADGARSENFSTRTFAQGENGPNPLRYGVSPQNPYVGGAAFAPDDAVTDKGIYYGNEIDGQTTAAVDRDSMLGKFFAGTQPEYKPSANLGVRAPPGWQTPVGFSTPTTFVPQR